MAGTDGGARTQDPRMDVDCARKSLEEGKAMT